MNEALRLSIKAGNYSPSLQRLVRLQQEEEQEMCRLEAVCRPAMFEAAVAEVDARAERITAAWASTPDPAPDTTPRAAAARSVLRDVARDVAESVLPF